MPTDESTVDRDRVMEAFQALLDAQRDEMERTMKQIIEDDTDGLVTQEELDLALQKLRDELADEPPDPPDDVPIDGDPGGSPGDPEDPTETPTSDTWKAYEKKLRDETPDGQDVVNVLDLNVTRGAGEDASPIDDALGDLQPDTTYFFPPGWYVVDSLVASGKENVKFHGYNSRLVPAARDVHRRLIEAQASPGFELTGFELYPKHQGEGVRPTFRIWAPSFTVSSLSFRGDWGIRDYAPLMTAGVNGYSAFNFAVTDEDGQGVVEDVYADAGIPNDVRDNSRFVFMMNEGGIQHRGTLTFRRVWAENWTENTHYGTYANGPVNFEDCYFRNTPIGLRVSDTDFRNVTIVKDGPVSGQRASLFDDSWNRMRGLWLQGGDNGHAPARNSETKIIDCDIAMLHDEQDVDGKTWSAAGPSLLMNPPTAEVRIHDTRIHHAVGRYGAVKIDATKWAMHPEIVPELELTMSNVDITQENDGWPAIEIDRGFTMRGTSGRISTPGDVSNVQRFGKHFDTETEAEKPDLTPPMPSYPIPGVTPNSWGES